MGAGLFAAAAFFAVMALIMLSVALAYFIHWNGKGLDLHWAFLIVFGFYLLVAALLGYVGYRKVRKVGPPEKAIAEAQNIKQALTNRGG
jgi:high-affinity Fe2+/Pb2+ permease